MCLAVSLCSCSAACFWVIGRPGYAAFFLFSFLGGDFVVLICIDIYIVFVDFIPCNLIVTDVQLFVFLGSV